jgi:hypothetical protein
LQKEINDINQDKETKAEEKQKKIQVLQKQMQTIDTQIQQLQQKSETSAVGSQQSNGATAAAVQSSASKPQVLRQSVDIEV